MLCAENSHLKQWPKILFSFIVVATNLAVTLVRGNNPLIDIQKCSSLDWSVLGLFVLAMLFMSSIGLMWNRKEQALKEKAGVLIDSDIRYSGCQLLKLLLGALFGGWVGGALGLGGGSIFNPLMISLGVPPSVSTSTGMFMIMFSTGASTMMYIAAGSLDISFAIWLSAWCSIGIVLGISMLNWLISLYGRQSTIVIFLVFMLVMSAALVIVDCVMQSFEENHDKID